MSKPIVAVVGRPNVGKSTLFNKLCGQRLAIVEDTPGITRDRIFANCEWNGHEFLLVDTGGIEPKATEGILAHMREQAQIAIDTADCIIMVVDVRDGLTAADEDVAHMLRRSHKPIILAVNKCDKVGEAPMELYEFYNLGFDEVMPISSVHGHGTGDLLDAVCAHLDFSETVVEEDRIPVAIIGRPNVGKSSLTNRILGENRMIVANEAGTTRDAIDTPVDNAYGKFIFTDTAGLREVEDAIEKKGIEIAYHKINEADLVICLFDASRDTVHIFDNLKKTISGKMLLVANKTDRLSAERISSLRQEGCLTIAAKPRQGLKQLLQAITERIENRFTSNSNLLITRARYREALKETVEALETFTLRKEIELAAEDVRLAARALGKITGRIEVDDILDKIFGSFCIGK